MRRRPRDLSGALARMQEELAPPGLLASVQRHWRSALGEQVAEEASPVSERAGVVTVRCRSSVWAAELTMMAETLRSELNASLGTDRQVLTLKFVAGASR
jgi:predicted nucleic acid-binding Zn ribbon protein